MGQQGRVSANFPEVMAQGHPHGHGIAREFVHQSQAVPQHAVGMPLYRACRDVTRALVFFKPGRQTVPLRQNAKKSRRARQGQSLEHFLGHTLRRNGRQQSLGRGAHLLKSLAGYAPVGPAGSKARQTKNSCGIIRKGRGRSRAHHFVAQVVNRLGVHVQSPCAVERKGIDGEIPRCKVRRQGAAPEGHAFAPVPQADIDAFTHADRIWVRGQKVVHAS